LLEEAPAMLPIALASIALLALGLFVGSPLYDKLARRWKR